MSDEGITSQQKESEVEGERILSQVSYSPTPYEDATWEIVGERFDTETFIPLGLEVVPGSEFVIDPMFANYGGIPESGVERYHLPAGLRHTSRQATARADLKIEDDKIALREEEVEAIKCEAATKAAAEVTAQLNQKFQAEQQKAQQQFQGIISDMMTQINEARVTLERQALEFALQLSKKVLDTTVDINPEYIVPLLRSAIDSTGAAKIKSVRVSSQDLEFINHFKIAEQFKEFDGSWNFEADESVRAGCIVETSAGEVDYDLDKAWERIKEDVIKISR